MRKSMILAIGLALVSLSVMMFGLVVLPAAILASLLILYFNWRREFLRRLASDDRGEGRHRGNEHMEFRTDATSEDIDEALAASFPASDPPAWNPGIARLIPAARKSTL